MTGPFWKLSGVLAVLCLAGGCSSFGQKAYERPDCHSKTRNEDCTNYVNNHKFELDHRDRGFEAAHRKQGYENLREQRRQRREQSRREQNPQNDAIPTPTDRSFEDIASDRR